MNRNGQCRMPLKKKILIGYGVGFVLMGLVVGWAVLNLIALGRASDAILKENYRSILAAENMLDALQRQDSGILLLLLGEVAPGVAQVRENEPVFWEWLARAKDNITIPGEGDLVQAIEAEYQGFRDRLFELTRQGATHGGLKPPPGNVYRQTIRPLIAGVRGACIQLRQLNEATMYAASVTAGHAAERAIWSTLVVAGLAFAVALVFSLLLAERIVRPIRRFADASRKLSAGDYAVQVPVEARDELGLLAGEFNRMAAQLGRYHELNIDQIVAERNKGEAILSSIDDGLVVFDTALRVTAINPAARRMLDLEFTACATLGCPDILPAAKVCDLLREAVESEKPAAVPDEQRIVTLPAGAASRHYLVSVTAIRGRDRILSGVVLLLRDVTRLKEVEQLKSDFVMAASHELRTPLTSLGMSVDLLREHIAQGLPARDRVLLQTAHEEVQRMKALVSDLLDLSRLEAGRIELEVDRVALPTLFDHALAVFKSQADIRQVTLAATPADHLPRVRADANKITWVLTNLISNALRYVPQGGHIRLAALRVGPHIHVSVQDDGAGIAPEYQTKIFQKFIQVQGRETGGTGLGLAICKEIVRAHGGTIWVESTAGQGSTFTFTLPAVEPPSVDRRNP